MTTWWNDLIKLWEMPNADIIPKPKSPGIYYAARQVLNRDRLIDDIGWVLERGLLDVSGAGLSADPAIDSLAGFYLGNFFTNMLTGPTNRFTFNNGLSFFGQDEFRFSPKITGRLMPRAMRNARMTATGSANWSAP